MHALTTLPAALWVRWRSLKWTLGRAWSTFTAAPTAHDINRASHFAAAGAVAVLAIESAYAIVQGANVVTVVPPAMLFATALFLSRHGHSKRWQLSKYITAEVTFGVVEIALLTDFSARLADIIVNAAPTVLVVIAAVLVAVADWLNWSAPQRAKRARRRERALRQSNRLRNR